MPERIGLVAELDLTEFDRAVGSYIRSVNRMERATHNVADSMMVAYARLGGTIAIAVGSITAALGGLAVMGAKEGFSWLEGGIEDAANFEQQLAEIGAVLQKTRLEVEPLGQLINKIALDPQLVVSTEEAGAVIEQLSRNGVEMVDILNGAAKSSVLLANATGGDFAMAADVATMAMHMFNIEASNLNRIADVSQQVINNTRIELDDWKLALGNGGAVAAFAGIDIEEFAATIESTINSFHSARQAGTSLMNFVQRLVPITKVAGEEFIKLGLYTGLTEEEFLGVSKEIGETQKRIDELDPRLVHYDELVQAHRDHLAELQGQLVKGKNAFFDESGTMKDWADVVDTLIEHTKGLSQEEKTESFRRMFGNDAMETAISLSKMSEGALKALTTEYRKSGQAQAAAEVRTATLAKRWENLKDIWESIRRLSGAKFIDMLFDMVNKLTALAGANQDRVIEFFGRMAELLQKVVDAAMPWVERMLPILIDNLAALASWLVEVALKGDKAAYWFSEMHPILQEFITRIITLVNIGRQFVSWVINTGMAIKQILAPFFAWVSENMTLVDVLRAAAGAVAVFLGPLVLLVARMALAGITAAKAASMMRRAWTEDWGHIRTAFFEVWPKIEKPLYAFINNFLTGDWVSAWDNAVKVVVVTFKTIEKYLPEFFRPFARFITAILEGRWLDAWNNVVQIARNSFDLIKLGLAKLSHPFTDFILRILEGRWLEAWVMFQRTAVHALDFLTDKLPTFFKPFTRFISDILQGRWWDAWNDAQQIAINVYKAIITGLDLINTPFTHFLSNVLQGKWYEAWLNIRNFAHGAFEAIKAGLKALNMPFTTFLANILEGKWGAAWEQVKNFAKGAYDWIIKELGYFGNRVARLLRAVLTGKFRLAWEIVKSLAWDAFNWIIKTLTNFNAPFTNFLKNILTGKWRAAWIQVQNAAVGVFEWLKSKLPTTMGFLMDALIALVQGRWGAAWSSARIFAIEALEDIRDFFGGGFVSDIIDILVNIAEGDWKGAWYMIKSVAIDALSWVRDHILPDILDPIANMLIAMINGDWKTAWDDAKNFVVGVRDWIVAWLDGFDTPFTGFFARVLSGEWKAAWEDARLVVEGVRDWIIGWLADKGPWAAFATDILQGEWKNAWAGGVDLLFGPEGVFTRLEMWLNDTTKWSEFAKLLLTGDFGAAWQKLKDNLFAEPDGLVPQLKNWLADKGPWAEFATSILEGDWKKAWTDAVGLLFGTDGVFTKIELWLNGTTKWSEFAKLLLEGEFGLAWAKFKDNLFGEPDGMITQLNRWLADQGPWGIFAKNLLTGEFGLAWETLYAILWSSPDGIFYKLDQWLLDNPGPWSDFARDVLRGQWIKAWEDLKIAVGLTDDVIKTFKDSIYVLIGAFALAIATMVSFQIRGLVGIAVKLAGVASMIFEFIPVIGAIAIAVALLRVAWEEDFLGIQQFTEDALDFLGRVTVGAMLLMGKAIDIFMDIMREDWPAMWEDARQAEQIAWQYMAQAAVVGLNIIYDFMSTGPGFKILEWLGVNLPYTLVGLRDLWEQVTKSISGLWGDLTRDVESGALDFSGILNSLDVLVSVFAETLGAVIGIIIGAVRYLYNLGQAFRDVANVVVEGYKAIAATTTGDAAAFNDASIAGTAAIDSLAQHMEQGGQSVRDMLTSITDPIIGFFGATTDKLKEEGKNVSYDWWADILKNINEGKQKLRDSMDPDIIDKAKLESQWNEQIGWVEKFFQQLNVTEPDLGLGDTFTGIKAQLEALLGGTSLTPATGTGEDPTNVYQRLIKMLKDIGVDITGDFLNPVAPVPGSTESEGTVQSIFAAIMEEVKATATGFLANFKSLGGDIATSVSVGMGEKGPEVKNAAKEMIDAAIQQIHETSDMHSPSKVFMELGSLSGQGYVMGWQQQIQLLESLMQDHLVHMQVMMRDNFVAMQSQMMDAEKALFQQANAVAGALADQMQQRQIQLNAAYALQQGTHNNYATSNTSAVTFGPIYVNNQMDGAELIYKMQRVMDSRKPL